MHEFRYAGGRLVCEDVPVESLVIKHGTPLYIYSQGTLSGHFERLDRALAPLDHLICYAAKANSSLAVLRVLANAGAEVRHHRRRGVEAGSGGRGGRGKMCFRRGGKNGGRNRVRFALRQGIYCFSAESEPELIRINRDRRPSAERRPRWRCG